MKKNMKLIVGLGNITDNYKKTRHNAGFIILDNYCDQNNLKFSLNKKLQSYIALHKDFIFCKPDSYMNTSGTSVQKVMKYFNINPKELFVVHDELDLEFGNIKFSCNKSSAGHNGVQDIINKIGTRDFCRLRIGIGKPIDNTPIEKYVLQNFTNKEIVQLKDINLSQYILVEQN